MAKITVAWISAGVSSFVATYLLRDEIDEIYYIHIDDQHEDSLRYIKDCERIIGRPIKIMQSKQYKSVEEACRAAGVIRMARTGFSPCTNWLKKRVRKEQFETLHEEDDITYVWGLDCSERERAERIVEADPKHNHRFPLIEQNLTKQDCHAINNRLGLKRPKMYDLGYQNNNCIGCVKGGMGYWNKIRKDFPEVFKARAELEILLQCSCLKECYLVDLDPLRGLDEPEIMEDCGIFCEIALSRD